MMWLKVDLSWRPDRQRNAPAAMNGEPFPGQLRAQPGEFTLVAPKDKQHGMVARQRPRQIISRQPQNAGLLGLVHRIDEVTTVPKIRFDRVNPDAHQTLDGCSGVDLVGQGGHGPHREGLH